MFFRFSHAEFCINCVCYYSVAHRYSCLQLLGDTALMFVTSHHTAPSGEDLTDYCILSSLMTDHIFKYLDDLNGVPRNSIFIQYCMPVSI